MPAGPLPEFVRCQSRTWEPGSLALARRPSCLCRKGARAMGPKGPFCITLFCLRACGPVFLLRRLPRHACAVEWQQGEQGQQRLEPGRPATLFDQVARGRRRRAAGGQRYASRPRRPTGAWTSSWEAWRVWVTRKSAETRPRHLGNPNRKRSLARTRGGDDTLPSKPSSPRTEPAGPRRPMGFRAGELSERAGDCDQRQRS